MARKLDEFPGLGTRRYPWEEWLNGEVWELFADEDYNSKTKTIVGAARTRARQMGGRARTRLLQESGRESVVLQFIARSD